MRSERRKWPFVMLVVVLAAGGWYALRPHQDDKKNAAPVVAVSVAKAERRDVPLEVTAVGNAIAYQTVAIRARLDSQVMEVKFHDGDNVKEGDLLFVLDDRVLKAQDVQMEAMLARDKAQLENLRQQYERSKKLIAKGFESAANLEDAKAAYLAQRATVNASAATLENMRVQLGYTRIRAPISGRTGTINVTVGNNVRAGDAQPLVTINQVQPIRVQMALPQGYLDQLRTAMAAGKVAVTAMKDDRAEIARGVLEYIDNNVNQSSGTFVARAMFENKDERLWPGMFVNAALTLGEQKQALTVPEVAVQHGQSGDYVFVIAGDKAEKRDVTLSRIQNGIAVIGKGLTEGEQVATDGLLSLKSGAAVTMEKPKAEEKKGEK